VGRHRAGNVASADLRGSAAREAGASQRAARVARAGLAALVALALASLGAAEPGARSGRGKERGGGKKTRTVVVVQGLDAGRQYARLVDRQRPALDRLDGTLRSGETEARVAAFLENDELRLIDERAAYGEDGGTARNRYYVNDGRLVYFESVRVRPRDVGADRLPARDEVVTALAFGENGALVGSEKTVNREPVALPPTDAPRILGRFLALAGAVEAAGEPVSAR
jgi:hypothetical protein